MRAQLARSQKPVGNGMLTRMFAMALATCVVAGCACTRDATVDGWRPPSRGVVSDKEAAIRVARALWMAMNPDLGQKIGAEDLWLKEMDATLQGSVWQVRTRTKEGELGGNLYLYISATDGKLLGTHLTQ